MPAADAPILLFDGVCNLCNRTVQRVIKYDKQHRFVFAALQWPIGQQVLRTLTAQLGKPPDSIVLYHKGNYYTHSDALIQTGKLLGGWWAVAATAGSRLPKKLRDAIYQWIARHRYRWYGKQDQCMVPTPELAARFVREPYF